MFVYKASAKRGTPLYGQPSWWGETDADEHNKQLLKDMQKQINDDKQHQKEVEEDRKLLTLTSKPVSTQNTSLASAGCKLFGASLLY